MARVEFHQGDQETGGGEAGKVHDQAHRDAFSKENRLDWIFLLQKIVETDRNCEIRGHKDFDQFFQ